MQTNLKGKTVLITESAHNFGRAIALAFAKEECNLLLASREGSDRLDQITQEVVSLGVKVATSAMKHKCGPWPRKLSASSDV